MRTVLQHRATAFNAAMYSGGVLSTLQGLLSILKSRVVILSATRDDGRSPDYPVVIAKT